MASEAEFWGRPFEPGPVRVDPDAAAIRARIVREAMEAAAADCEAVDPLGARVLRHAAIMVNDEPLAKLGRLLK